VLTEGDVNINESANKVRGNNLNFLPFCNGKRRLFLVTRKDQTLEKMEKVLYDTDNCVPFVVSSEESYRFWRLVLRSGNGTEQLHDLG
jgi:hypothetical protein